MKDFDDSSEAYAKVVLDPVVCKTVFESGEPTGVREIVVEFVALLSKFDV